MIKGAIKNERKDYHSIELDSSSSLKEFSLDRKKYYKKWVLGERIEDEEKSKASVVGELVETLLFEPKEFDNRFYMSSIANEPTGHMLLFVNALYKYTAENTNENGDITIEFEEIAKLAHKESGYKWSLEKVLEKFNGSDAEIFYNEIRQVRSKGLTVVTIEDVQNAEKVVQELKTNETTAPILNIVDSDRYTVLIQHQIEGFEIDGLKMKSMIDHILIDHKEKTIQVSDLKCTYSVENFLQDYYLYRRAYFQAYTYREAAKELKEKLGLEYYTVLNPQFIVCDSISYYKSLIYTLNSDDIEDAYIGFEYNGRYYPGVKETIDSLKWAKENNIWNVSKKNYINGGIVNIRD